MTDKILDWLNHNRHRAYPLVNDDGLVSGGGRIPDCVILDCLVMDTRPGKESAKLVFTKIQVSSPSTVVSFEYDGNEYSITLEEGVHDPLSDNTSTVRFNAAGSGMLYMKFVFSSHDYILENVGTGTWSFRGTALSSKVVAVAASGVMGLEAGGSAHVDGRSAPGVATGAVRLEDGYRTQPVIQNGKVVVKVGTPYGLDPCHYREDDQEYVDARRNTTSCGDLMFFFCGQNAVDTGDVELEGGPGVTVRQGGSYTAKEDIRDTYGNVGIAAGEAVPCIEVVADSSLLGIYRPSAPGQS